MRILAFTILNLVLLLQGVSAQTTLGFQGNETGNTWGFTTTGASANALTQANSSLNYVTGTKSIVVGGNTGGGSCYQGGSGNGTTIENKITFLPLNIATSNTNIRTLTFSWGSRHPVCAGTGWDAGEDLSFTPILDGVPQTPIILAVGNVNMNFNIQNAAQKHTYSIPACINTFAFELTLPTNRRDELLFVDDVKLTAPALNTPFALTLSVTGDASVCTGNTSTVSADAQPGISYEWSGLPAGASFTTPNNTPTSNNMTIAWGTALNGTYTVKVKPRKTACGIDVYGAETSFQVVVNNNPTLTISPASSICLGASVTIQVSGAATYNWNNGLGTNNSITVSPTTTTTYVVTGSNGTCTETASVVITVNPAAISAGNDLVVCAGTAVTLSASGGSNYTWDQGVTDGIPFVPTATSTYTVTTTGICAGSDQVTITVEENPVVDFSSNVSTGCTPLNVQFENLSTGNNTYQWSFGDGNSSTLANPNHVFTTAGCTPITLTASTPNGCTNTLILDDLICLSESPTAQFSTSSNEISSENSTIEFTNQSIGGTNYAWNFGDGNLSTEFAPFHTFDPFSMMNQLVTLMVTNDAGCIDSAKRIIQFTAIPSVYVPNAFTPNGDEHNQVFSPKFGDGIDPTKYHFLIFNRWGEIVFETRDLYQGWDGTYQGKALSAGEYVWKMRYGIVEGVDQIERIGHVTIVL